MSNKDRLRAELYLDMIAHISTALLPSVGDEQAYTIAVQTVDHIRRVYGGIQLYIPKDERLDTQLKHHAIFTEFNGSNSAALSQKYQISVQHVYRVLKQQYRRNQPDFFEEDDAQTP